ncbi:MAG: zf-HC2 domain-containing protein [Acidobacteriota bacterium]
MKPFGKTKDGVIDSLLRAYVSRPGNPPQACPEFDPDLANAYIERSLPPGSRSRYEEHLSECAACRKNVVALVRLNDTAASVPPARDKDRAAWLAGARQVLGSLSRPQWAMATAAVLVLAISLPVLLSRDENRPRQQVSEAISAGQPAANPQSASRPAEANPVASSRPAAADSSTSPAAPSRKRETDTVATNSPEGARNAVGPGGGERAAEQSQKSEAKSPAEPLEAQRKSQGQLASQPPAQAAAASSQVAKNESEERRQEQQSKDSAQQAREARPGRVDEPRDRDKTAKADEVTPPPATASSSELGRVRAGLRRTAPKLALRDSAGESVRPTERRVNKKEFLFRNNTWTDKDFDPNKNLPVVTIIRDSNVYREEIDKSAKLKAYFMGFSETERAIIVYKGKVYKLIPQQGDK